MIHPRHWNWPIILGVPGFWLLLILAYGVFIA
jgi:hypothetical protein